jgi:flagellar biosynthesis/type III secretory pathway M-ring protein FliF/YscJ
MVDLTTPMEAPPAADGSATPPAKPAVKLQDVESVVRSALGLKETDAVKVIDTPFHRPVLAEAAAEDTAETSRAFYLDIAKHSSLGVLVIGALVALKIFSGPRRRTGAAGTALPAGAGTGAVAGALPPAAGFDGDPALLRGRITEALQQNPDEVKRLFANWAEGERGEA